MSSIDLSPASIREIADRPDLTDNQCVVIATHIEYDAELWKVIHRMTDDYIAMRGWDKPTAE